MSTRSSRKLFNVSFNTFAFFSLKVIVKISYTLLNTFQYPSDLGTQYIKEKERQLFVRLKEFFRPTSSAVFSFIDPCTFC